MCQLNVPRFLGSNANYESAKIILAGFPYDCTASYRPGARFAAREVRAYSQEAIEPFSFYQDKSLEDINFFDAGDMEILVGDPSLMVGKVKKTALNIMQDKRKLLGIGGEHLVTYPLYSAAVEIHGPMSMLHLDAHADLRDEFTGSRYSHASVMKLCLDDGLNKLVQIGIRSGSREEYYMRKNDPRITVAEPHDVSEIFKKDEKIYLSLDVDYFDAGFMPGTGTPEAGGANFNDFIRIIKEIKKCGAEIVCADVVELAPDLDPSHISTAFTAKLIREILMSM